ncbi:MAG TPA: response regulator [Gammaproteobacteria bacterium]|nr:response regulator [Gammaproteobacteria bacterium]
MSAQLAAGSRVLIVEDDPVVASLLARALRARHYQVEVAASGQRALELAAEWRPRAVILDLKLGDESGMDLIPVLVRELEGTRIVVLTGYASIATAVYAIKLGASDYLAKPVEIDELLAVLTGERSATEQALPADAPSLRRLEWEHIQRVLTEHDGNISETARVLGIQRRTLQRKLAKRPVKK